MNRIIKDAIDNGDLDSVAALLAQSTSPYPTKGTDIYGVTITDSSAANG